MRKSFLCILLLAAATLHAQSLDPAIRDSVDRIAGQVLAQTGVPSASIAIVKNSEIAYVQAYGAARLEPRVEATPAMRYSIGSISKQFTATAILMLAEQGKLSLDDPVSRFVPDLTRSKEVTIRQLLSHTSGYQDYWPQDYVMPGMLEPTTAQHILDLWARIPLDFNPGTQWQYSNTNYVIAGMIVEKAAGMPLLQFLRSKVFAPLGMTSVLDIDAGRLTESDPTGYMRYALGPLRPAPKEGTGWLFAAGELAMTPQDLAKWDISIIRQRLLKPVSYLELETAVRLKNGLGTGYGLGVDIGRQAGHRVVEHTGEVSGFTAANKVFPDDGVAVVVLTNQDAVRGGSLLAERLASLLLASPVDTTMQQKARQIFEGLQQGKIDRSLFTANANFYFSDQALQDFASSLGPLGPPQDFTQTGQGLRGGMKSYGYRVKLAQKTVSISIFEMPDGKLEQYQVRPSGE